MLPHFQRVQTLRGELKRSEVRSGMRFQLTTKEFILQRDYRTYRIALENILGLVECSDEEFKRNQGLTMANHRTSGKPYKIVTTLMHTVSPNGVVEQSRVSFYTRLSVPFASQLESLLGASG